MRHAPKVVSRLVGVWLVAGLACTSRPPATAGTKVPVPVEEAAVGAVESPPKTRPPVEQIIHLGREDGQVDAHLRYLAQEIGPRLTSSHNLVEAERWCRDQFAQWGLDARLEQWGEAAVGFDRGPWSGRVVGDDPMTLEFTTMAWTPGIFGPARGRARTMPSSVREVKRDGKQLHGAWIMVPTGEKEPDKKNEALAAALRQAGIRGYIERASDRDGTLVRTSGELDTSWSSLPQDVIVHLKGVQFDAIAARMKSGEEVELEFSIDNRFFKGPVPQHNVIADIRGSTKPDEYVIVGGHLDSWDGAQGAVDNATGVATTMEAARLLMAAGAKPERTIRFMLWSGEEQGLHGSRGYVERHPETLEKTSAVLVHDMGTNYLAGIHVTPEMLEDAKAVFAPVFELNPDMPFAITLVDGLIPGGSDHTPFIRSGVPGFFWEQRGRADYRWAHHTQNDTVKAVIPEYQRHSAIVVAIAAYNLANLEHRLDRTDSAPIEFRETGAKLVETVIRSVEKGSKAAKVGWKVGDTILAVAGTPVESRWDVFRALQTSEPKMTITLERNGRRFESVLDFSESPAEKERARRRARREQIYGPLRYGVPVVGRHAPDPDQDPKEVGSDHKDSKGHDSAHPSGS